MVRLGNYLAALGKSFREITPLDLDRFIPAVIRHGPILDLKTALTIIPLRPEHVDVSASLHNQILFAVKAFYTFLDMRHAALIFGAGERPRTHHPDAYKPFLAHIMQRKARRHTESRSDHKAKAASTKRAVDHRLTLSISVARLSRAKLSIVRSV